MPRLSSSRLTTDLCRSLPPGDYSDADVRGLSLRVTRAGSRTFFVRYRDQERKQRRVKLGKFGALTLSEARSLARDKLGSVARGEDPAAARDKLKREETVSELVSRYIKLRVSSGKICKSTETTYHYLEDYIGPVLGDRKISKVTHKDAQDAYQTMAKRSESRAILAIKLLRSSFNLAKRNGLILSNPCLDLEIASIKKRDRFLSQEERGRLWTALETMGAKRTRINPAALDALRLITLTGARKSFITRLMWSEVDLDKGLILKGEDAEGTKNTRKILLSDPAVELLKCRFDARDNLLPWVFPAARDPRKPCTYLENVWKTAKEMANIEDLTIHGLRHSFASDAASQGLSLPQIGDLLGHRSTSSTARYAHLCESSQREALDKVSERIEEGNKGMVIDIKRTTS